MANEETGILSTEEAVLVSGGSADGKHTVMSCEECGYYTIWDGDFMDGLPYPCEGCGEVSMYGTEYC